MNILYVEDKYDWFKNDVEPLLVELGAGCIYHAATKKLALSLLKTNDIDYVILDLAIPNEDINEAPDIAHGISLATEIRAVYPGTPILVLSGQPTQAAYRELEEDDDWAIFWDGSRKPLVKMKGKDELDDALELIRNAISDLNILTSIPVDPNIGLNLKQKRIIQLFARANNAIAAKVKRLDGGLSSSTVLSVSLINEKGNVNFRALAKIDDTISIDKEISSFQHIKKLPIGRFPTYLEQYFTGCGNLKGVFFQLAEDFDDDFFSVLVRSDHEAYQLAVKIRASFESWEQDKKFHQKTIGDIRRCFCSDEKFLLKAKGHLVNIDYVSFESKLIKVNFSLQHSDLHGKNILVSNKGEPLIIDYGDIDTNPSVIDPITLELSCYFHPATRDAVAFPSGAESVFFDAPEYSKISPYPQTFSFLRGWALENGLLSSDIIAVVYAYSVRQLTHDGTNKQTALKLIRASIDVL